MRSLVLNKISHPSFNLKIQGVQIHTDGCIIARGYDEGYLRNIRRHFAEQLKSFPSKQSQWAHIPLGRILGNPPPEVHQKLIKYCSDSMTQTPITTTINQIKLIYERQWYMKTFDILAQKDLS